MCKEPNATTCLRRCHQSQRARVGATSVALSVPRVRAGPDRALSTRKNVGVGRAPRKASVPGVGCTDHRRPPPNSRDCPKKYQADASRRRDSWPVDARTFPGASGGSIDRTAWGGARRTVACDDEPAGSHTGHGMQHDAVPAACFDPMDRALWLSARRIEHSASIA